MVLLQISLSRWLLTPTLNVSPNPIKGTPYIMGRSCFQFNHFFEIFPSGQSFIAD